MNKLQKYLERIFSRLPYLPDFGRAEVIMRIVIGIFYICLIYSFVGVDSLASVTSRLYEIIKGITPYILIETLTLILVSNRIKKLEPVSQILILSLITLINVYIITSITYNSPYEMFSSYDKAISYSVVSLGFVFFFLIYFDWSERNTNPDMIKAKLISLQSKMRPHFLFNTLNSISFLIEKKPEIARDMLQNLSELLRATLKDSDDSVWTISDEIEICKKYLSIEKIRLADRLNIVINFPEDTKLYVLPKISIQPIIENAILHGIQNSKIGGTVEINVWADKLINIEIKNTPCSSSKKTNNGYSMKNLHKRLNMFFKGEFDLKSEVKEEQYLVTMRIPKLK